MNRWCVAAGVAGLAVVAAAVTGAALLLRGGISAREAPSAAEARIARTLRGWAIPTEARDTANPVPATPGALAEGLAHFADHCASCHANDGSGRTRLGRALYPRPPDLRAAATQGLADGELFHIIENGVRFTGMPAWGEPGHAEGSWQLVHFIRHLPRLTAEERARMEALNPRPPDPGRASGGAGAPRHGEEPPEREGDHRAHPHAH